MSALAQGASAAPDLSGVWTVNNTSGPGVPGTLDITNGKGGAFDGTGYGGGWVVKGSASGNSVHYTVSGQGSYVSTVIGTLSSDGTRITYSWTDTNGASGTAYLERQGGKASLSVSVSSSVASGNAGVGDSVTVKVTVAAVGGDIKSISLGKGLASSSDAATIATSPGDLSGFSLSSGASRSFTFTVKAAKAGTAKLSAAADGEDSAGDAVSGSDATTLQVGAKALAIKMVTSPSKVELKLDEKGKIKPDSVTVKVTVTNTTKSTISGVQLLSLSPEPVDPSEQLDQLAFARGALPVKLGTFAPGSFATRSFTLKVTGDGRYQIRALALYNDPNAKGGNGRAVGVGGDFEAVAPLLYFTAELHKDGVSDRGGSDWVKGGESWYVGGTVKNLSSSKAICLSPLLANNVGNAEAVGMQDVSNFAAGAFGPPMAGLLKPGQSVPLGMLVETSSVGGTRGTVEVPVTGFVAKRDATCQLNEDGSMAGAGAALTKAQTEIARDSTGPYVMHIDVSVAPDTTPTAGSLEFFGRYAETSFKVFSSIALGLAAMAKSVHDDPQYYVDMQQAAFNPAAAARLAVRANHNMMAVTQLMVNYLRTATPAESTSYWDYVAQTLAKVKNDAYAAYEKGTEVLGKKWFGRLLKAEESGDANQIWTAWAGLAGEGFGELNAVWLQMFVERAGVLMTAKAPELEAAAKAATAEPAALTTSKGGVVPYGRVLSPADAAGAWAIPAAQDTSLRAIAHRFGVRIGVRSRQAISTTLEKLGAVWKNSNFHQKTVSEIDRLYLRMGKIRQGLLGTRSFTAAGTAQAANEIRNAGLTAAQETEALARLAERINEGEADLQKLKNLATTKRRACSTCPETEGWVNTGFNATESGSAAAPTSVDRWRRFKLVETPILSADGQTVLGTLYEPFEENIAYASAPKFGKAIPELCRSDLIVGTVLCPITGDLDLVYVIDKYGGSLAPSLMQQVFGALEEAGFAHTDLVTWVEQQTGSFFFPGKEKQLAGLALGGEATIEYGTDALARSAYLDVAQSILTGSIGETKVGPNAFQLAVIGGENAALR